MVIAKDGNENFYTFCDACNQMPMCGLRFRVKDFTVKIENWPHFPNSPLCARAYALVQELYHPQRLLYPLMRSRPKGSEDPCWVRITWDEAYKVITSNLNEIKEKYGPESIVFYVGNPKEPRAAVQRLCYTFGSPNYATESSTTCRRAAQLAEMLTFGFPTLGSPPTEESKLCVIWGTNPAWSRPFLMTKLLDAKDRGVKFIVVDPRKTPTVEKLADFHLQLRPATDGALALGIINVMIKEEIYDKNFVEKWVYGFEQLRKYSEGFTPEIVEKITWIPAKRIVEAAHTIADNTPVTFLVSSSSTTHNRNGVQNHRAILALIALTGCLDIVGGIQIPTYQPIPTWDIGDPIFTRRIELLPRLKDKRLDLIDFPVWAEYMFEVQLNKLPEYVKAGKVKAMIMWGGNLMMWPQSHEYQDALKELELVIAIDYFYRPWTHNYVDILLPAATCFERKAPFAFFGRKIYARRTIKPLGECKEDWQIVFELGVRLGYVEEFWKGDVSTGLNTILSRWGLRLEELENNVEDGITIPTPGPELYKKYELGKLRADGKPGFPTPTSKIEVYSTILEKYGFNPLPEFKMPMEPTDKYPLILITGSRVPCYAHSRYRELPWLRQLMPEPVVNINPEDASERNIEEEDSVIVESPWGRIKVKAHLTMIVPRGVVDVLHGWHNANVNELIPREFDPISGFPPFKECICEVRKL